MPRIYHVSEILAQMNLAVSGELPPELRPLPVPASREERRRMACDQRYRRAYRRVIG